MRYDDDCDDLPAFEPSSKRPAANHSSVGDDDARRGRDSDRATADAIHEKLEHDGGNPERWPR
jgi:hypothetical protein